MICQIRFLFCRPAWIGLKDGGTPVWAGTQLLVYFDGSHVTLPTGPKSGAGVAAYVHCQRGWRFAGALSTILPDDFSSYQAEAMASIIATKFLYDLLKMPEVVNPPLQPVEVTLCYDSLTAGLQASGQWHAYSEPRFGHLVRSLHKCIEQRFKIAVDQVQWRIVDC